MLKVKGRETLIIQNSISYVLLPPTDHVYGTHKKGMRETECDYGKIFIIFFLSRNKQMLK
jgi:hypothetical protein